MDALPRICVPEGVRPGPLVLSEAQARHLAARRLRRGDEFLAFAGDGREYRARVGEASRDRLTAIIHEVVREEPPPPLAVEVWCANMRANRMEWAIEKCTEAGVDAFRPITTERSVRGHELSESRRERWERIAIEAAEQCGRLYLPVIAPLATFEAALQEWRGGLVPGEPGGRPLARHRGEAAGARLARAGHRAGGRLQRGRGLTRGSGGGTRRLAGTEHAAYGDGGAGGGRARAGLGASGDLPGAGEDGVEHLLRQLPREGVALAGVVGVEQRSSVGH